MSLEEIGLCALNMLTILGSIININYKDLYDHLMNVIIFIVMTVWIYFNHLAEIATCFILYESECKEKRPKNTHPL